MIDLEENLTLVVAILTLLVTCATLGHALWVRRRRLIVDLKIRNNRRSSPPDLDLSIEVINAGREISLWLVRGGYRGPNGQGSYPIGNFKGVGGTLLSRDQRTSTVVPADRLFHSENGGNFCFESIWLEDSHRRKYRVPSAKKTLQEAYRILCVEDGYARYRRGKSKPINWTGEWSSAGE